MSVDGVFRTRSLGVAAEGLPDQYADGKAAKVWQHYIGNTQSRTQEYKSWVVALLRKHGVRRVLDVACGTGVDSIMLVEEGFNMVSVDASDKMLKYALKARWERRKEAAFDQWVIEEANWLTLPQDVQNPGRNGFDAVICLGNSFAHLPDFKGDQSDQKLALQNIASMVKPGGILIIDHRNYDYILETGRAPQGKNVYYKSDLTQDISTSVLWVNNKPHMITLDYTIQVPQASPQELPEVSKFRLSYYPHRLENFKALLQEAFNGKLEHNVYGDFMAYVPGQSQAPCYFIHVCKKTA
ncbi:glycine N-methyltransferase isoform X1 [Syngnathus typhle]|uniref:glycine N-methyltransferase isoform X1 n=1 Tax=Syngnathus typhle TaxID=161592 RepID=UPI002A6A9803|nr:glycine N-methyltransferase isoform X1 [Syngnathus typhle]